MYTLERQVAAPSHVMHAAQQLPRLTAGRVTAPLTSARPPAQRAPAQAAAPGARAWQLRPCQHAACPSAGWGLGSRRPLHTQLPDPGRLIACMSSSRRMLLRSATAAGECTWRRAAVLPELGQQLVLAGGLHVRHPGCLRCLDLQRRWELACTLTDLVSWVRAAAHIQPDEHARQPSGGGLELPAIDQAGLQSRTASSSGGHVGKPAKAA